MMASALVIYYANYALLATHLQLDLHLSPAFVALPIARQRVPFHLGHSLGLGRQRVPGAERYCQVLAHGAEVRQFDW